MFTTRMLRAGTMDSTIRTIHMNPYKARKQWPPDVSKLDAKHQFRLERKYRRRSKLKFERPRWIKSVKLVQWGLCFGTASYCILFMDWKDFETPFPRFRKWIDGQLDSIWTVSSSQPARPDLRLPAKETDVRTDVRTDDP